MDRVTGLTGQRIIADDETVQAVAVHRDVAATGLAPYHRGPGRAEGQVSRRLEAEAGAP